MNNVLLIFLSLSLSGSILALILFALKPFVKNKLSQTWQYYIWLIVILRFLLPFTPQVSVVGEMVQQIQNTGIPMAVFETEPNFNEDYANTHAPQIIESETSAQPIYWRDILSNAWLLWLGVALVIFVYKVASYRSFMLFVNVGTKKITDSHILDVYKVELEAAKIKRPLPLYFNDRVASPMLVGIIRPILIFPVMEISSEELRHIFRHELTHYKRLDFLYKWLAQFTLCLHWFNPLVYLICKQIDRSCELSCDETAIKCLDKDGRVSYGDALMTSLEAQGNYSNFVVSMTMSANVNSVKERLDMIMKYRNKSKLVSCAALFLTVLFLSGATFVGAYAASASDNLTISVKGNISDEPGELKTATVGSDLYYLIDNEEQLRAIGSDIYPLSGKYMLNADITLTKEVDWIPIGTVDHPFTGTFTGNGFEIVDLTITNPAIRFIGMFGHAENANIYNITLRNVDIKSAFQNGDTIGAIVAWGSDCDIYDNQIIDPVE